MNNYAIVTDIECYDPLTNEYTVLRNILPSDFQTDFYY